LSSAEMVWVLAPLRRFSIAFWVRKWAAVVTSTLTVLYKNNLPWRVGPSGSCHSRFREHLPKFICLSTEFMNLVNRSSAPLPPSCFSGVLLVHGLRTTRPQTNGLLVSLLFFWMQCPNLGQYAHSVHVPTVGMKPPSFQTKGPESQFPRPQFLNHGPTGSLDQAILCHGMSWPLWHI
jgi:hypothetical protein